MTKNSLFNTPFEVALRLLVLMDKYGEPASINLLTSLDLLCTYGKSYGITNTNLHGDNSYCFNEVSSRLSFVTGAIKYLVTHDYAKVHTDKGFRYSISSSGLLLLDTLESQYIEDYEKEATVVIECVKDKTEFEINKFINEKSKTLGGSTNE